MDEILRQIGELLLASIPTIVLFLILFLAYTVIVHKPLVAVLNERRARTQGAVEKANADIAAAEARTAEYEQRLRDARLSIFKKQEAHRQQLLQARASAVAEARSAADAHIKTARTSLEKDVEQAKVTLQAESESLASKIIQTVLKQAGAAGLSNPGGVRP